MKNLLNDVKKLDEIIRQLQKMESKMRSGQWIDAWRELTRIVADLKKSREEVINRMAEHAK